MYCIVKVLAKKNIQSLYNNSTFSCIVIVLLLILIFLKIKHVKVIKKIIFEYI